MKAKSILLIFALALPVSIFVFLHMFGRNEFEIPVYFQEHVEVPEECDQTYTVPYKVNNSSIPLKGTAVLFFASDGSDSALRESIFQLERVNNEIHSPVSLMLVRNDSVTLKARVQFVQLQEPTYLDEKRCVYMMASNQLVLIDSLKQIRGFYKDGSMKEVDRLILELKILLNEY